MPHRNRIVGAAFQLFSRDPAQSVRAEAIRQFARGHEQTPRHSIKVAVRIQGDTVGAAGLAKTAGHGAGALLTPQKRAAKGQQFLVEGVDRPVEAAGGKHGAQEGVHGVHIFVAARGLTILAPQKGMAEPRHAGRGHGLGHARRGLAQGAVGRRVEQVGLARVFRILALKQPARGQNEPAYFALPGKPRRAQALQMADELPDLSEMHGSTSPDC